MGSRWWTDTLGAALPASCLGILSLRSYWKTEFLTLFDDGPV